jgi:hypothetical protein
MKTIISLAFIASAAITLNAQTKPITAADYDRAIEYAASETNKAFPFVYNVLTQTFESGKLVSTETEVDERQAQGVERETKTLKKDGKTFRSYSVMVGFGDNTYCSSDGVTWKGPQKFVCPGPDGSGLLMLYGPKEPESVEYSVTEKSLASKPVKVYRKYATFAATEPNGKKSFEEEIATIDSRGFFISIVNNQGTLDPKAVNRVQRETWDFKTKFKPVVAPKQL